MAVPSIAEALRAAAARLAGSDSARLDAQVLLAHVLGRDRTYLFTWPERALEAAQAAAFDDAVARRAGGEPVAYILGHREFWSLDLLVSPATLIPRPDTELLVELALATLPLASAARVLDLGTGTGAIALALAVERPGWQVTAVDAAAAAVTLAQTNARRVGADRVEVLAGDWFEPVAGRRFDLIVSNPPYVCSDDPHLGEGDVRFEPHSALVAGGDGLDAIRTIAAHAPRHAAAGARLLLEHGCDQGEAVRALLFDYGYDDVATHRDAGGRARATIGRIPHPRQP